MHKHARVRATLDRVERENKPFARELVHASIKLEMSCTVLYCSYILEATETLETDEALVVVVVVVVAIVDVSV